MKTRLFAILCTLAVFLTSFASTAFAEPTSIVSYRVHPKAFLSSNLCQRLTSLEQWEPFYRAFTEACDEAIGKELTPEKLEGKLPNSMIDDIHRAIDRGLSTRRGIEAFFGHVDAIVFELQADLEAVDLEAGVFDLIRLMKGEKIDMKVGVNGVLAALIDENPRNWLGALKYLEEGKDYEYLRNETDGDFALKFDFKVHDHKVKFCCAGIKVREGRYALIFSCQDSIERQCEAFKTGKYANLDTSKPLDEIVFEEPCFLFLESQRKRFGWNADGAEFLGKVKRIQAAFQDVDGVSQFGVDVRMETREDARAVRDLLAGLVALVRISQGSNEQVMALLQSVGIDSKDENVSVVVKLDNAELWKIIADGLGKATREIKDRR